MSDDAPRPTPRFVPTLTEVVALRGDAPAAPAPAAPPLDADTVAAALLRRLGPELDREVGEAVARALHEQMQGFSARVRAAVADVVREAVAKALAQGAAAADDGKNP